MVNIFEHDRATELKESQDGLIRYFSSRLASAQARDRKIQLKINQWSSLRYYQYFRSDALLAIQMRKIINEWFEKYAKYLDATINKLLTDIPMQCSQTIFELLMADLLARKYDLIEKSTPPDLFFDKYFMECTTSISSVIDEWDKLLPVFDDVINIFEMMFEKSRDINQWFFEASIIDTCRTISSSEKEILHARLLKIFPDRSGTFVDFVCDLIHIFRYACMYFKEIVPEKVIKKLNELNFPLQSITGQFHNDAFLTKRLAMSVCGKLKESYFSDGKPGVIAVSLALVMPGFSFSADETMKFIEHLKENLISALRQTTTTCKAVDRQKIINGMNNLYAIIVDTCWYNWFPDIFGVGWDPCKNIYCAIYNENFMHAKRDQKIFDSLVRYEVALPLGAFIEE